MRRSRWPGPAPARPPRSRPGAGPVLARQARKPGAHGRLRLARCSCGRGQRGDVARCPESAALTAGVPASQCPTFGSSAVRQSSFCFPSPLCFLAARLHSSALPLRASSFVPCPGLVAKGPEGPWTWREFASALPRCGGLGDQSSQPRPGRSKSPGAVSASAVTARSSWGPSTAQPFCPPPSPPHPLRIGFRRPL